MLIDHYYIINDRIMCEGNRVVIGDLNEAYGISYGTYKRLSKLKYSSGESFKITFRSTQTYTGGKWSLIGP